MYTVRHLLVSVVSVVRRLCQNSNIIYLLCLISVSINAFSLRSYRKKLVKKMKKDNNTASQESHSTNKKRKKIKDERSEDKIHSDSKNESDEGNGPYTGN